MTTEQEQTLESLKTAIQMEIDGKQYYLKASKASTNPMGERLFATLAKEEDSHRVKFEEIYKALEAKKAWPKTTAAPHAGHDLQTVFSSAAKNVSATANELEAVQTALTMENRTRDFYQARAKETSSSAEREYLSTLAEVENTHAKSLHEYYEYLKNPAGYFVMKERHSIDGG